MNQISDHLKTKKILLVDDEPQLLKMTEGILHEAGFYNIITADCVKRALAICGKEQPDLAILDVMLPDGNGYNILHEIRQNSDIPVLFLDGL